MIICNMNTSPIIFCTLFLKWWGKYQILQDFFAVCKCVPAQMHTSLCENQKPYDKSRYLPWSVFLWQVISLLLLFAEYLRILNRRWRLLCLSPTLTIWCTCHWCSTQMSSGWQLKIPNTWPHWKRRPRTFLDHVSTACGGCNRASTSTPSSIILQLT